MAISTSTYGFVHQVEHGRDHKKRKRYEAPAQTCERQPEPSRKGVDITNRGIAEIVELVERKLAWFGFRSVTIGPFIKVTDRAILIDLLTQGNFLCRIEVDRQSGAITRSGDDALAPLIASLRRERSQGEPWETANAW
jgi:hypothetical protein